MVNPYSWVAANCMPGKIYDSSGLISNYQKQNDDTQGQLTSSVNWIQSRDKAESQIIDIWTVQIMPK